MKHKRTPTSCPKRRQLSGVDRKCDRGFDHVGAHRATTVTGVDRYWIIGIPVEFATEADAFAEVKRRAEQATAPTDQGGGCGVERL